MQVDLKTGAETKLRQLRVARRIFEVSKHYEIFLANLRFHMNRALFI